MGLFRLAAIAAIGVSLLPADPEKQDKLYERVATAANWTLTFCERNAETCAKAHMFWADFSKKAEFGAKLAYDAIRDKGAATGQSESLVAPARFDQPAPSTQDDGTLTSNDLKPAWRGKTANKNGI